MFKKITISIISLIILISVSVIALGDIIWKVNSLTYVSNDHPTWFDYYGYGQCNSSINTSGYYYTRVAIRYRYGPEGDTGFLWTNNSSGSTVSVSKHYKDSLNPVQNPKTTFNYDYERTN